ncbi:ABC transporter ATP-binding protein [Paracoccus seriniphilus]|uniref:Putative spermidine/putrescine transport system ATP-binding protein n=1 Tax=Paracoccus seriniphilus TaxID=184748 RepID=A0A239Q3T9_9RHOB|nr:ABC transporter ATP-binding protein [Paracoccus seriniphilus]WCR15594.1 ABC transporter ATP-binding protein [Paracoccus seriniphilus]SNT76617.1 putative spermidine/putrescine transport system ATP-binding protein [Paracoccus seriniphilus]
MATLSLKNIEKNFGTFQALRDVNLEIGSAEFICLLGGSGCGKTTLLRIIAGLETPTSGEMLLDGTDLTRVDCHKRNVGMVFQSLALFPHLNVGQNIAYGLELRGVGKAERMARATELLDVVGLSGLSDRPVSALSGGQRQRVAIARALAIQPALFLMDEPFSALDAGLREHLQIEVKKLQRKLGVTTIFVTHDQNEAMSIADRIVILNEGRIEQAGTPTEIYSRPQTRFVADFMGTNNIFTPRFSAGGTVMLDDLPLGTARGAMATLEGRHTVAVRPEYLSLRPAGADSNGLVGTVDFVRLLGASIETELSVGDRKFIHTMVSDRPPEFAVGEKAEIHFDLDHAWIIPS